MAATELATAYVSLVPSMRGAQGSIAKELAGVDLDGTGRELGGKLGNGMLGSLKSLIGPAILAGAGAAIGSFAVNSVAAFSELEDSTAAAGVVFGDSMSKIIDQSKTAGSTLGLSSQQVISAANTYGTYGKAAGLAGDDLAAFATEQTALAADLASFKGTSPEQAIEAIGAALRGETEPIRAYGVMLDDASLKQEAMAQGLITSTKDALTPQNKILAARALIMKQTTDAQGDFNRTSDSTANVAKTLAAETENLSAKFGGALAPAFTAVKLGALEGVRGMSAALDTIGPIIEGVSAGVINGIAGIKSILIDGNFTDDFASAFGVEEDSRIVDVFLTIRETVITAFEGIRDFIRGFKLGPELADSLNPGQISGMAEIGIVVRDLFNGIAQAIGPLIPHVIALWSSLSPLNLIFQAIQPFLPPLLAMFGQLASVIGGTLISAITAILPSVMSLQTIFVELLQGVLATALPVVVQLVTMLGETFAQLLPVLIPIIATVMQLAATLISQLVPIFMELVTAVLPIVVSIMGSVLDSILPLVQMLAGLLIPIIQALMPVVVTVFSVVVDIIKSAMQIVQGIIQVVTGIISGNWSQVFQGLGNIASGVFSLIVNIISGAIGIVSSVIGAGLNFVGSIFSSVFNGVVGFLGGVWSNITNGVSGMIGGVLGFFSGLPGRILGALGNLGSILFNAGRDIIQGLINGISGMMGAIGRAVINIIPEAIRGPFESLLGIASPSKVFIEYGHNIGQGLVLGIEDMYDPVAEATAVLAAVPAAPDFATSGARAAYAAAAGVPDTAPSGPLIHQDIHPAEKMSEENLANISAGKIVGALT